MPGADSNCGVRFSCPELPALYQVGRQNRNASNLGPIAQFQAFS